MLSLSARSPALALAFLFVANPSVRAEQAQKATIERIEIRGNHRYPEEALRSRLKSKPGDTFDEALLKLDLGSLYETGFFDRIEIDERDGDTGKIVIFQVTEKPVISAIEFVGLPPLRMTDIEACFKEHKIDFKVNDLFDASKLRSAQKALEQLLAQHGRRLGRLRTELRQVSSTGIAVRFVLAGNSRTPGNQ